MLDLLRTVVVDLLHEAAPGQLLLLPPCIALGPLALRLIGLQLDQHLLALGLPGNLDLQGLRKFDGLLLRLGLLGLLRLRHFQLARQDIVDEVLVECLLHVLLLFPLCHLDGHELVGLGALLPGEDALADHGVLLLILLSLPQLFHLVDLVGLLDILLVDLGLLHLQLHRERPLLLLVALPLEGLLPLLALDLGEVSFVPELVVELVVGPLLGLDRGLLVQLVVAVRDGLELHDPGVHGAQIVDARTPLLVQLLLDDRLPLVLSSLLQLVGADGHLVHPLLRRLLTVHHLFLIGLLLG
mmetsp:Transcript_95777/g.274987  ORF Transcript_95777/g.274987 Transcript_95777/m.274987 type:complete len:298 (-) Transcript_95777:341-1234(-)